MEKPGILVLTAILILSLSIGEAQDVKQVSSPDKKVRVNFKIEQGKAFYNIKYEDKDILDWSALGFKFKNSPPIQDNLELISTKKSRVNNGWKPVWGQNSKIKNNYRKYKVSLKENRNKRNIDIIFRVYNDGIGFRYKLHDFGNKNIKITSESTEFNPVNVDTCWWLRADYDSYESLYNTTPLKKVDSASTPLTMRTEDNLYISLHEADLTDYAGMKLIRKDKNGILHSNLVPWPDGIKVKRQLPFKTPWRTVQIGTRPGDLIESNLILNLNDPRKIENTDWIKPMKYVGIWWGQHIGKYTWGSGLKHGATTENAKRYIDFASKAFNSDSQRVGFLVEGWNIGWDGDWTENGDEFSFTESYPDFDVEEVTKYCKANNIEYIMHNENAGDIINYENQLDTAFSYYNQLGIHAVKTGNVADNGIKNPEGQHHHGQYMVNHYRKVVKLAAQYDIMLNAHEPIKPTGISRTWPNMMTREGVRGMEYNAWSSGNTPEHTTILPFTRLLAGPADYTPGIFDLTFDKYSDEYRVHTTLAKQLAHYVVLYSPMQMAADLPSNYKNQPGFQFIKDVPVDWDNTKVIKSKIGDYIVIARKSGESWYLGSITDENSRLLDIPLNFLDKSDYRAEIYCDASGTGLYENPSEIDINKYKVNNKDTIKAALSKSGGIAVRFIPNKEIKKNIELNRIDKFNDKSIKKIRTFKSLKDYK